MLDGDGLAQHAGNDLCLAGLFAGFDLVMVSGQQGFFSPILTSKNIGKGWKSYHFVIGAFDQIIPITVKIPDILQSNLL